MTPRRSLHLTAIWAISFWPAFNFLGSNWPEIERRGLLGLTGIALISLVLGIVGHLLERRAEIRGQPGATCLPWLALVCLIFSYMPVSRFVEITFEDLARRMPVAWVWCALAVIIAVAVLFLRKVHSVIMLATAFSIAVGAMAILRWSFVVLHARQYLPNVAVLAPVADKDPRLPGLNVYYILLDAYGGRSGVMQATGFDNAAFFSSMEARGFQDVSSEKSNYLRTTLSLGGIFSLDYPKTDDPRTAADDSKTYPAVFDAPRAPPLIARLNAAGYTTFHSATSWGGCAHNYLECLGESFVLDSNYLLKSFLEPTPFARPIEMLAEEHDDSIRSIATRVPLLLEKSQPFFIFAHDLGPHPPFARDAQCKRSTRAGEGSLTWFDDRRSAYAGALQCLNSRILELVDFIVQHNPNALIVLQGDHGSAFGLKWDEPMTNWSLDSIRERRSFLNLVRAPADCRKWLDHPMGQINTARFVVACVEGRPPEYLPERGYMSTYEGPESGLIRVQPDF